MLKVFDTVLAFSVVMLVLSLVVTAIVQTISALLDLRGKNLVKAVKLLVEQAAESNDELKKYSDQIAAALVKHPAVATGWHATAKALHSKEVGRLLEALATDGADLEAEAKTALRAALTATVPEATPQRLDEIKQAAASVAALFPGQADAVRQAVEGAARQALTEATTVARKFVKDVEGWFDTVMDRSSEWFLATVRWWTVGVAFVVAFGLQVDSLGLLRQITTDDAARAALVERAASALDWGEEILGPQLVDKARDQLAEAHADQADALRNAVGGAQSCDAAAKLLGASTDAALAGLAKEFREACAQATVAELSGRMTRAGELLDVAGLHVYNEQGPLTRDFWCAYLRGRVFLGTLMTALFLSLGAPFWFNALRQLVNLRPIVAGKVEAKAAAGSAAKT